MRIGTQNPSVQLVGFFAHSGHYQEGDIAMTRDQKTVGIGAASGVAAMIAAVSVIYQLWPTNLGLADGSSRLVYALRQALSQFCRCSLGS